MAGVGSTELSAEQEAKSWKLAKQVSDTLKPLPIAFTSSVRLLVSDHLQNKAALRPVTKFQVARVFKSDSFKAMLYYSALALCPNEISKKEQVNTGDLMRLYSPMDLAALIGMFVMYRKVRRLVDEQEWSQFKLDLNKHILVGGSTGVAVPKIGMGTGILAASMPLLSLATLYSADAKAFANYRRTIQKANMQQNPRDEVEIWGCSSYQIATLTLSLLGYGVDVSEALMKGLETGRGYQKLQHPLHLDFFMARLWLFAFLENLKQPKMTMPGDYYPLEADRAKAQESLNLMKPGFTLWFERGAEDISPEKTPQLFAKAAASEEIPQELQEVFSMEEITAMEENDFDDLIDQIDLEAEGEVQIGNEKMGKDAVGDLEKL